MSYRALMPPLGAAMLFLMTPLAAAQTPGSAPPATTPPTPIVTILTTPRNANVSLRGETKITGVTPLDLPTGVFGRYTIIVEADGLARTHGVILLPERGGLPMVLSEPREGSLALFLRGLFNYPGAPDMVSGRSRRGGELAFAATGSLFMAGRAHLSYRDRLDELGDYAADRARDERRYRNSWLIYAGGTLGWSALDYWIRPRLVLEETTPSRMTLNTPETSRLGAIWRSLLVPGAGQEFGNHRTRSLVWLGTVLFSAAGFAYADYKVNRDETDVKWAKINVSNAGPSELQKRLLELEQQQRDLDASEDVRLGFAIAAVSFYGLNLFDSMIMPLRLPTPRGVRSAAIMPVLTPEMTGAAVSIHL